MEAFHNPKIRGIVCVVSLIFTLVVLQGLLRLLLMNVLVPYSQYDQKGRNQD